MRIAASTAANLAGSIVPALVALVTIPVYIQVVGQERYGILVLIWLLLGYFGLFDLGLGRATAQRIAALGGASDEARARVFWTAFLINAGLGLLGGIILCLLGSFVLRLWPGASSGPWGEALGVVPWVAAAVPLITVSGVLSGALQGRGQFLLLNLLSVIAAVLGQVAPLGVAMVWGPDLRLLVPTVLFTRVFVCAALLFSCLRLVPLHCRPAVDRILLRPLLSFGGWVTVTAMISPVLTSVDRFVIGALAGAKAVTQYSVPFNLVSRVLILPGSLSSALFPRFAVGTAEECDALLARALRGLTATVTPLILVSLLGMRPFLTWWLGGDFAGSAATVGQIIALGLWFNSLAHLPYVALEAQSRPDLIAKCHLVELPIYLGLLWAGLHLWGVVGAALAWSLRVSVDASLLFWLSGIQTHYFKILAPNGVLLLAMAMLVLGSTSDFSAYWQWILATVVLFASAAWSWRSSDLPTCWPFRISAPVAAGLDEQ